MNAIYSFIGLIVLSLLILQVFRLIFSIVKRIYPSLLKHRRIIGIIIISSVIIIPFVQFFAFRTRITMNELFESFGVSLAISFIFAIILININTMDSSNASKRKGRRVLPQDLQNGMISESDWHTDIEIKTLEQIGVNSTSSISFDELNKLGSYYGEQVLLEHEIDSLRVDEGNEESK